MEYHSDTAICGLSKLNYLMPRDQEQRTLVFYSWQSDLPDTLNRRLIRNALNEAANEINQDDSLDLHVTTDEATRDSPGSPNIADTIFEKIRNCDIFVCDLTKTAEVTNSENRVRKFCNPNVAIELGYAVRTLGWGRIVIVFNEAFGILPDDLPFDARVHRTLPYRLADDSCSSDNISTQSFSVNQAKGDLRVKIREALKLIVNSAPKRPHELETKTHEEIRRTRDLQQLHRIFYFIHLSELDLYIDRLGYGRQTLTGCSLRDGLELELERTDYHLNDEDLNVLVTNFVQAWGRCNKHWNWMFVAPGAQESRFETPGDLFQSNDQEKAFKETTAQAQLLRDALDELLSYVRKNYIEIDPRTTGKEAVAYIRSPKIDI